MGFNAEDFVGVVTSGEVTHQHLLARPSLFWRQLGRRCLHFSWGSRGAVSLEGLGLQVTLHPWQRLGAPPGSFGPCQLADDLDASECQRACM